MLATSTCSLYALLTERAFDYKKPAILFLREHFS